MTSAETYTERVVRVHEAIAAQNDVLPKVNRHGYTVDLTEVITDGRGYGGRGMAPHEQIATTGARASDAIGHEQILANDASTRRQPKPDPSQGGRGGAGFGDSPARAAAEGRVLDALRLTNDQLRGLHRRAV